MEETIKLIKWLRWTSKVEINNAKSLVSRENAIWKNNIYFCAWLWEKIEWRCSDDDISTKKYFVVDLDIRLDHYNKTWIVLDWSELQDKMWEVISLLEQTEYSEYCAIVNSWNGMHLYYSWEERPFHKETYSNWVSMIYEWINHIIQWLWYKCDPVCNNLARIMRLPWTINPRKKMKKEEVLWDLWPLQCEIMYFEEKNSELFWKIEELAEEYKKQKERDKQEQIKIKEIMKSDYKKWDDMRTQINNIPACDIACDIRWVTMVDRWLDNVALKEQHKNMWAYRYKPHNVIVNTGSSMIKTDKSYFTTYELVYYEMMWQDKKATVDYFKNRYWIVVDNKQPSKSEISIPKLEYEKQWYLYGNSTFDDFDCIMSWELATIVARSNSWKTTFAMDIIQTNAKRWKKCYYINLEFPIETMRESRWIYLNKKKKRNLTDIDPLTDEERETMNHYVQTKLKQFDYHNNPNWMKIEEIVDMIISKQKEWYWLFVIDTFSRISWNLDSTISHTNQNKSMETFQELCQNLWVVVILLHHTNKNWVFEWTQKIMDLSNVFITITADEDLQGNKMTKFELTKDKFVSRIELETYYIEQKYALTLPKKQSQLPF